MEGLILNDTHNFLLQNYTGEYNGTKFNFKVSKDGRGQIHRIELMDWNGKDMIDLSNEMNEFVKENKIFIQDKEWDGVDDGREYVKVKDWSAMRTRNI